VEPGVPPKTTPFKVTFDFRRDIICPHFNYGFGTPQNFPDDQTKGTYMKRIFLLGLTLSFLSTLTAWAEDPQGVPIPVENGTDILPPPIDLSQITPLPLPGSEKNESNSKEEKTAPPPAQPTDTPIPPANPPPPAQVQVKKNKKSPVPTPTIETAVEPSPAVESKAMTVSPETAAPSLASAMGGAVLDYFPVAEGSKANYEYLKAAPGAAPKRTRVVECMGREQMPNGTLHATFQVTEDGKTTLEKYSLFENKVQHSARGTEVLTDDFAFKLPKAGSSIHWTQTVADGTVKSFKVSFGQGQVYQKVYPDCVVVTEKTLKGGKAVSTVISYFAKGVGMVAVEVYSAAMKLNQAESIALVQP
jgi:hypothetical protein